MKGQVFAQHNFDGRKDKVKILQSINAYVISMLRTLCNYKELFNYYYTSNSSICLKDSITENMLLLVIKNTT